MKDSVDGGEGIASGCKPEEEGFDSPSTLPKKIEYEEVKPGLWISKDDIFTIRAKINMIPQKEIDEVMKQIDELVYKRPSLWKLLIFILIGSMIMIIINFILGVW